MPEVDERSVALHERDSAARVVLKVSLKSLAELSEVALDLGSEAVKEDRKVSARTPKVLLAEVVSENSLGVGGSTVTARNNPDHRLQLRRNRDVREADRAGDSGDLLLVLLEGVAVGEDDGDGPIVVVEQVLEILGDGGDVERLDDADELPAHALHE